MEERIIPLGVFWVMLFFVFYTYMGYPLFLFITTMRRARAVKKDFGYTPSVSFLIVAYNEETVIRGKLENTLSLQYPKDRFEIVVASDGSTDRTNEIVGEFKDKGVLLVASSGRMGKTSTLNEALPVCRGDIVILSDARQIYAPMAVKELVANFSDPTIGAVTGDLQFCADPDGEDGEHIGVYWRYEKWIRGAQSSRDSTTVVTGAIYAIRKSLFRPLPKYCIADDLAMAMSIINLGYRVIFDATAKAYDNYTRTLKQEFRRRVRTIAGSYQYILQAPEVLIPKGNRIWFDFMSHKVCRVASPFALLALFLANIGIPDWPYRIALVLQIGFYTIAGIGAVLANYVRLPKVLSTPYTFLMLNVAASVALFKLLVGKQTHLWDKTSKV